MSLEYIYYSCILISLTCSKAAFFIMYLNMYSLKEKNNISFFHYNGEMLNGICSENIHVPLEYEKIFVLSD